MSARPSDFPLPADALVLGAGASGCGAARLLLRRGVRVSVAAEGRGSAADALEADGAAFLPGRPAEAVAAWAALHPDGLAVSSPGIPPSAPEIRALRDAGVRILGELGLGAAVWRGRLLCVTGSKGKSSLAKLLADALSASGRPAVPCGNYGTPLCSVCLLDPAPEFAVCECSSFQLETAGVPPRPETAVLLNLSRDHLDRHGSMEAYRDAKLALFADLAPDALAVLPAGPDPWGVRARFAELFPGRRFETCDPDAVAAPVPPGSYFANPVLAPAAAAAALALRRAGLSEKEIGDAFGSFEPLPHRMQSVALRRGVRWIDNSKATSLEALLASVRMAPKPVFLVAGGRLKEPLWTDPKDLVEFGVEKVYTVGECAHEMAEVWSPALPVAECGTLPEAVKAAARDTAGLSSGSVLLAPGTASFDQFDGFEERGRLFASLARSLS